MPEPRWEPGAVVGGYRIERRLARGGMAELFVACPVEGPAQSVVIKRVHAHLRSDPGFDAMFVRETRIAASLHHPNIVRVLETGRLGDEVYLVMELLVGLDGRGLLRRLAAEDNLLSYGDAIQIVIDAAKGLSYAHNREGADGEQLGIVHRDVSPSNLFITTEGEVKLVDFGIAKTTNATQITGVGVRKGKGAYMAPEQCMAGVVDRRTDVFALGAVLYELTTMTRAFDGDNELAVLHAITSRDVEPPSSRVPDYPRALEVVVMAALQRDPAERWSDADALAQALKELSGRREFQGSTATLASLVGRLVADDGNETDPAGAAHVDLTPPPFGVSDRSDGALLLPTPTNMEAIAGADSEQINATGSAAVSLFATRATTSGEYQIGSPSAGQTVVAPPNKDIESAGTVVRPAIRDRPQARKTVPTRAQTQVTGALSQAAPNLAVDAAAVDSDTPPAASSKGRIAAVAIFVVLAGGALWWLSLRPEATSSPASTGRSAPSVSAGGEAPAIPVDGAVATPSIDADAVLARLNDPGTAGGMSFDERHGLIRGVTDAGKADDVDLPLHLYLDLNQARQSATPCATFRGAWGSLGANGDAALVARVRASAVVPTKPGKTEKADACNGLDDLLAESEPSGAQAAGSPPAARARKPSKPRREPKAPAAAPDPRPESTTAEPAAEPKPKPGRSKPEVGGKLDDELRPFGK